MFVNFISEPITVINFFVLEHGRLEEFVSVGVAEMREGSFVLAHQVNDVTQRMNGHLVALQGGDNDLPQLLDVRIVTLVDLCCAWRGRCGHGRGLC